MEQENIRFGSVDDINYNFEDVDGRDIEDTSFNIELDYIKKWELEQLNRFLEELTEEEREFLIACYEDAKLSDSRIGQNLGLPRTTVQSRRVKLLEKLKKRFVEEEIEIFLKNCQKPSAVLAVSDPITKVGRYIIKYFE